MLRPSGAHALLGLLSLPMAAVAFQAPCANTGRTGGLAARPRAARLPEAVGQAQGATRSSASALAGAAAAAALAVVGAAARAGRRQHRGVSALRRGAFCSGSSSFMGTPTATAFGVVQTGPEAREGVAGMGMKAQVWWIQNNGFDGRPGKVFDSRRRESRRRGEEMFRHDVDTFELTQSNLIRAPGSRKFKIRRGRGKYGHHGRTCGFGNGGAKKRGRRTINPGYEGGHVPLHIRTPILTKEQRDSMKRDPFTPITLGILNMCSEGEKVDYMDLFTRGFPVTRIRKFDRFKVKGDEKDEFTVKNLTVYAHAFEPAAREKIEDNGGKCVRLHEWSNLPLDEQATAVLVTPDGEEEPAGEDDAEE
uniref:Large ribosomal subunit protein uL15/eL18 domain-containing protein n=1 Tax=Alexandrium catenella TaxID=2925 RepID=A0A7S1R2I1_ALECA|mmetsp:Transcript_43514/g.117363  ORF Transcript_43514/g.117363 Transcript_43514/m.117363 type:complete len:363 (+) Transcript_43514:73-1161(+)